MVDLHPRLAADTVPVELPGLRVCRAFMMNDSRYAWIILVPWRAGLRELHELSPDDLSAVMDEVTRVSRALQAYAKADKMNVAALGNMVPQLHIHVIARHKDDAAWPGPVWGVGEAVPYADITAIETAGTALADLLRA